MKWVPNFKFTKGTPFLNIMGDSKVIHYTEAIMSMMASQITGVSIVYSTVCSGADQRKHQSSTALAFVRGIHHWPMNSPHKGPVTQKMFHLMTSSCFVKALEKISHVIRGPNVSSEVMIYSMYWLSIICQLVSGSTISIIHDALWYCILSVITEHTGFTSLYAVTLNLCCIPISGTLS